MKLKITRPQDSLKLNSGKSMIAVFVLALFMITSCTNSKAVADSAKLMRGDWTITNVTVDGIQQSYVDITVFDEANSQCYVGSAWHLVQNNATGNYTINAAGDCPSGTTKIKWFVTEEGGQNYFNFKKVYEGEKPKNVVDGYKMRVTANTGSTIVLVQDLMFEGKPISVNYTFQKNS